VAATAFRSLVDRRVLWGGVVVILTQTLFWLGTGVVLLGTDGSIRELFETLVYGMVIAVPLLFLVFVIAFAPVVVLWLGLHAVFRSRGLTARRSALIAAPMVAFLGSTACVLAAIYWQVPPEMFERDLFFFAVAFPIPGTVAAEIYAMMAWPRTVTEEGTRV
jgi:hypothetical protein